ncbi:hypothetical protein BBI17_003700 [Phytophthora kernoviae]|uniref:Uncharacterized protein n=1 Tax=Phytophthora kernoviae TaxID=325452 RepID=A0A3R7FYF2_9STRA|nr:hypothetical protein JM16_002271 [Phytophthora kernoviae]KAG2525411.1 hypothetical protein JM18_002341 [Phytophthora kernoviae]RLN10483.1 hypothetical protein BBI17_003700 [Phytophthora kernoviae]
MNLELFGADSDESDDEATIERYAKEGDEEMDEEEAAEAEKRKVALPPEELFKKYDTDGSGNISASEFLAMLPDLGFSMSAAKALRIFRKCDTDGGGEIDLAEFKMAMFAVDPVSGNTLGFSPSTLLGPRDAFELFDEDGTGQIDELEFADVLEYFGMDVGDGKQEKIFKKYDKDKSGYIDYNEFRSMWVSLIDDIQSEEELAKLFFEDREFLEGIRDPDVGAREEEQLETEARQNEENQRYERIGLTKLELLGESCSSKTLSLSLQLEEEISGGPPLHSPRGTVAVTNVSAGGSHVALLMQDGSLYTCGIGASGRLGLHQSDQGVICFDANHPQRVEAFDALSLRQVSCSFSHSAAIDSDGALYTWGSACNGKLGVGIVEDEYKQYSLTPLLVKFPGKRKIRSMEDKPWWEVDLGQPTVIERIRLWNRTDEPLDPLKSRSEYSGRLYPCWILVSEFAFKNLEGKEGLRAAKVQSSAFELFRNNQRMTEWLEVFGVYSAFKYVGRVGSVQCSADATLVIMPPTATQSILDEYYLRAIQADADHATILRQYDAYERSFRKFGRGASDILDGPCRLCRVFRECEICEFYVSANYSRRSGGGSDQKALPLRLVGDRMGLKELVNVALDEKAESAYHYTHSSSMLLNALRSKARTNSSQPPGGPSKKQRSIHDFFSQDKRHNKPRKARRSLEASAKGSTNSNNNTFTMTEEHEDEPVQKRIDYDTMDEESSEEQMPSASQSSDKGRGLLHPKPKKIDFTGCYSQRSEPDLEPTHTPVRFPCGLPPTPQGCYTPGLATPSQGIHQYSQDDMDFLTPRDQPVIPLSNPTTPSPLKKRPRLDSGADLIKEEEVQNLTQDMTHMDVRRAKHGPPSFSSQSSMDTGSPLNKRVNVVVNSKRRLRSNGEKAASFLSAESYVNPFAPESATDSGKKKLSRRKRRSFPSAWVGGKNGSPVSKYLSDFSELGLIGSGSFSKVFKCMKKIDGWMYAVKKSKRHFRGKADTKKMVHMDVKLQNVLVAPGEIYKLGDLGTVAHLDGSMEITEGDNRYLSRELLEGNRNNLRAGDIFALGATIYELALGTTLSNGGEEWQKIRDGDLVMFRQYSNSLQHLIANMMHPDALQRPLAEDILQHEVVLPFR